MKLNWTSSSRGCWQAMTENGDWLYVDVTREGNFASHSIDLRGKATFPTLAEAKKHLEDLHGGIDRKEVETAARNLMRHLAEQN